MRNRMDFFIIANFEYNHDFEKIDDVILEYVFLYEKDYYKFLLFRVNNFTI